MDKKMEKMRKDIKARLVRARAFAACMVILIGVIASGVLPTHSGSQEIADYMEGFQLGLVSGIAAVALVSLVRYQRALSDDAKLKALYYKENDERANYINLMAGKNGMNYTTVILLIAAVIVGYFSVEAFVALIGAVVIESLVKIAFKIYYGRSMCGTEE